MFSIPFIIPDVTDLDPSWSVVLIIGWITWELYAPTVLGNETRLSPLFELPNRVSDVEETTKQVHHKVEEMDKKQVHHIQVTRAQARALDDDKDVTMSSKDVDEYLVDNGIPVALLTRPTNSDEDDHDISDMIQEERDE